MEQILLIITNVPDPATADSIASTLIKRRLAACVNILAPCRSVYCWDDNVETSTEIPVFIKAPASRYAKIEACIREFHPYQLPEIIGIPIDCGLPDYLHWVIREALPAGSEFS